VEFRRIWDSEGHADWSEVKSWIERASCVIYAKMKNDEDYSEYIGQSKHWNQSFRKTEWRKNRSRK
jgi:hypothetical protein